MATETLQASLPQVVLVDGFRIVLEAISPTTGAAVADVVVSSATILLEDATEETLEVEPSGPFMLVPGPGA